MHLTIDTIADVAKGFALKREKQDDDTECAVAHLKFTGLRLDRDQLDELLGRAIGWTTASFYDELGAPFARCVLSFPKLEFEVTGTIRGPQKPRLTLKQATLSGLDVALADKCVLVSGELAWEAAGDEVTDVETLLGQTCGVVWTIRDGGQQDMLAPVGQAVQSLNELLRRDGATASLRTDDGREVKFG